MATEKIAGIGFELTFDGSKMLTSINSACTKVRNKFQKSFEEAGNSATRAVKTSNDEINKILEDTERSAKSKAASIAAIYKRQGDSQEEAFKKVWSHIERDSSTGTSKVNKSMQSMSKQSRKVSNDIKDHFSGSFTSVAKKAAIAFTAAFSVKKIIDFGKECLDLGSDLQEVQNVVDVTFPSMTAKVDAFAKSAASSFGLSETMAKKFTGTFGAMAKSFGFSESAAYEMGSTLTGLAGDIASFYNITQDEAYTKLKSVFTGETESLKDLGVVMTQSALDSYALANGFGKTTQAMSEAEKVALRYQFVQNQLSAASGDFARTSGSWANQVRILNLQFESLKATIGQGLINLFTPVIRVINSLIGRLSTLANAFKAFTELITGKKSEGNQISGMGSAAIEAGAGMESASAAADNMASSAQSAGNAAKKAAKEMRSLMGFDQINKLSEQNTDSGSDGSTGGSSAGSIGSSVDFGTLATGETTVDKLNSKFEGLFTTLKKSLEPLSAQLKRFGNIAKNAFTWLLENVLKPLANFTITEVVPRFFQTLANVLAIVNNVLEALQPLWQWFWDNLLQPIASWTGSLFLKAWDGINDALEKFSDWCAENPTVIQTIATILVSFATAWGIVKIAMGLWNKAAAITTAVTTVLSGAISFLTSPIGLVTIAIGLLIAAGVLLYKNWDTIKEKAGQLKEWLIEKTRNMYEDVTGFFRNMKEKVSGYALLIKSYLQEKWQQIREKAVEIWQNLRDKVIQKAQELKTKVTTAVENLKQKAASVWSSVYTTAVSKWASIKNKILDFANTIKEKGIEKFQAFRNMIRDIFQGLVRILKIPINAIIGMINGLIGSINGFISKVNDALTFDVGFTNPFTGNRVGFRHSMNIPPIGEIPYLAQGGFVQKNTPRLAVIGDNRHYGEITAPEDKMMEMAMAAARAVAGTSGLNRDDLEQIINQAVMRIISALSELGFYLDSEQMATAMRMAVEQKDYLHNPVIVK